MSLFAIADTHLSFGAKKKMDIFDGWENYTNRLKCNWENIVNDDDTVVIAGDISWGISLEQALPDFEYIESLPGQKLLVKGNHDYWWDTVRKMNRFFYEHNFKTMKIIHNCARIFENYAVCGTRGWFYDASGNKKILLREAARLERSIIDAEKSRVEPIVFLHYPPVYTGYRCDEILDILKTHKIRRCYFGHLHGIGIKNAFEGELDGTVFRLISCDNTDFTPVMVMKD